MKYKICKFQKYTTENSGKWKSLLSLSFIILLKSLLQELVVIQWYIYFFFLRSRYNPFHISLPLFIVQYTENRQEIMNYEICKIKLDHIWKYIFQYSHNLFSAILWVSLLPLWHFKYFRYNMRRSILKLYGKKFTWGNMYKKIC